MKPLLVFASRHRYTILLVAIVTLGAVLRLYHLGFQSLWYDEIHSAAESDPAYRDHSLWYFLMHVDQQPPLFFILEQVFIFFFGNNEIGVRLLPAVAGIVSIWAVYGLGKAFVDRRTGLYAALFLAVNTYAIHYSMEARPYSLALLFSMLSWTAMLRLLRDLSLRRTLVYVLWTLLMLYSNYFSVFVVMAQALAGALLLLDEEEKWRYIKRFLTAGVITGVCFLPLLIFLQYIVAIDAFWGGLPEEDFGISYFHEYFGKSDLLKPFLYLLLICFFVRLILESRESATVRGIKARSLVLLTLISIIWVVCCLFIPFVRSYLVVPMLVPRYTIMVLPAFIVLIAAGLGAIRVSLLQAAIGTVFCLLSLAHLILVLDYYNTISKSQFRELAMFMSAPGTPQGPVIGYRTPWQQRYYLKRFGYRGAVLENEPVAGVDSLLKLPGQQPFWISALHVLPEGAAEQIAARLGSRYIVGRDIRLYQTWGRYYVPANFFGDSTIALNPAPDASLGKVTEPDGLNYLALWLNRSVKFEPVNLAPGRYSCIIQAKGTKSKGEYAHLVCKVNGRPVGNYYLNAGMDIRVLRFSMGTASAATVELEFDNDQSSRHPDEDRNAYVHRVMIRPDR
jgi:mannosyltransferase